MRLFAVTALILGLLFGFNVPAADLAANLCQDEFQVADEKLCQGLLIGTIDSLYGLSEYCPDGATSYGHVIAEWRRLLRNQPTLKKHPTVFSMRIAVGRLSLTCNK